MKKHAEVCPVCKGRGVYIEYQDCNHTASTYIQKQCHGCNGSGWVTVTDDCTPEVPYYNPYGRTYYMEKCDNSGCGNENFCDYYSYHTIDYNNKKYHFSNSSHIPRID